MSLGWNDALRGPAVFLLYSNESARSGAVVQPERDLHLPDFKATQGPHFNFYFFLCWLIPATYTDHITYVGTGLGRWEYEGASSSDRPVLVRLCLEKEERRDCPADGRPLDLGAAWEALGPREGPSNPATKTTGELQYPEVS